MSHTPGPWTVICDSPIVRIHEWTQAIDATKSGKDFAEDRANARLIAAAPDLLAALRIIADTPTDATRVPQEIARVRRIARAAIAKAGGKQ